MSKTSLCFFGGAALLVGAVAPPWAAGQDVNIVTPVGAYNNIYGNGDPGQGWTVIGPALSTDSNKVTVGSGGSVSMIVYGGDATVTSGNAAASSNAVNINGGMVGDYFGTIPMRWSVIGGYADSESSTGTATAQYNNVTISDGTVARSGVFGGYAASSSSTATATKNTVDISGNSTVAGPFFGQTMVDSMLVFVIDGNAVTVSGGYATSSSGDVTATSNAVTVSGGTVKGVVIGGYVYSASGAATAQSNTVTISGGTVTAGAVGGTAENDSGAATVTAAGNAVTISGGMVGEANGGSASSAAGAAMANNNTVTINGGDTLGRVIGGGASSTSGAPTATGNTVIISSGTVGDNVYGGWAISGSTTTTATATASGNTVTISGGAMSGDVYGGHAQSYSGTDTATATASGNAVTISGGAVSGDVYGGYAEGDSDTATTTATATGNIVTISGAPNLTKATLYGGYITNQSGGKVVVGDAFGGNTLNLHTADLTVAGLHNFQNLNFYVPTTLATGGTMLHVTGTADLTDGAGRSSTVNVGIDGASSPLRPGDQITLIDAGTLTTNGGLNSTANGQGMQGVTLLYNFNLSTQGNQLLATVPGPAAPTSGVQVNPQAKALSEGFLASPALINQTADFVADQGVTQAVQAAGDTTPDASQAGQTGSVSTSPGLGTFGAISGGWNRYNTGSHDDLSSLSLMAGLAWGNDLAPGRLTLAAFFEYGNGWYDTYNSFANAADVHGKGNIYHLGGGILGRMNFNETEAGNFYTEVSARAGGVHNDYKNGDLRDAGGLAADYDTASAYYGAHAGLGYVWRLTAKATANLYGKYFWTRQNGDSVRLSTGDPIRFDDVDSHRLRVGGRFLYAANGFIYPYVGAAYEQELDGKAKATTNGYALDTPSLQGGTGIGELGLTMKPAKNLSLFCDLGVQGYVGTREGFTASVQVRYDF